MFKPDIKTIIEKHFQNVYRLAFSRTQSISDAEDATQEVFLKLIKSKNRFENEEHIKAWLIRVTLTTTIDIIKKKNKAQVLPLSDEICFETPEHSDIYQAVSELPLKYRTVIHLYYYEDLPITKIAEYLMMKEATVKTHLARGRKLLQKKLAKEDEYV